MEATASAATWHGTSNGYRSRGCRCELCRAAERERLRARRALGVAPNHGTYSGYKNYGCRCALCRAAWAAEKRAYRARRAERERLDKERATP